MTDGPRQRSSTSGSAKDAASEKESGGGVALKKEIGLVSACGIIVGKCVTIFTSIETTPPYGETNLPNRPYSRSTLPPLSAAACSTLNEHECV